MRWLAPFLLLGLAACGNLQSGAPGGGVTLSVGIEEPRANSQTGSRTIVVRASAMGITVERVEVEYQGQGVQDRVQMRPQGGKWVGELPQEIPLGTYTLKAVAFAGSVKKESPEVIFTLVPQGPVDAPVVQWVAPSNLASLQGTVALRVLAKGNPSPVVKVFFLLERDANLKFIGDGTPAGADFWDYTWDTQGEANGRVRVRAVAVNAKGVQVSAPQEVVLNNPDRENPSVVWLDPLPEQNLAGEVTLRVRAEDNMGVDRVTFFAGGRTIGEDTSPPYELRWDTTGVEDGLIDLKAIAFDAAGNRAEATVQVVVRNTVQPPLLEILSPEGNEPVGIRFRVQARVLKQQDAFTWSQPPKAQVYDYRGNRVAEVPLLVNGVNPPDNQDSLLEAEIDLGNVPADTYRLVVEGRVLVGGNEYRLYAERTIQVRVDSNLPPALVLYQPFSPPGVPPQVKGPFLYLMGEVTDDSGRVHALEVRLVQGGCANPGTGNYLLRYEANPYGLFYFGVPLDGQPYIPDGLYCLRAVAIDAQDQTLRYIQEFDIRVDRNISPPLATVGVVTESKPGATIDPAKATWTVTFSEPVTFALFLRKDGRPVAYLPGQGSSAPISRSFGEGDVGVWDVVVVYQASDGRQGQAEGGSVAVVRVQ